MKDDASVESAPSGKQTRVVRSQGVRTTVAHIRPRTLRTVDAARYLGVSPSLLRKLRARRVGDPGLKGPKFVRASASLVLYELVELDRWLTERIA
jgi:hypothetical protein